MTTNSNISMEAMTELLLHHGFSLQARSDEYQIDPESVKHYASEFGYHSVTGEDGTISFLKRASLTANDLKALSWVQHHHGSVKFCVGYIHFNEDGSIDHHMACPLQDYVIVRVGFEERTAKTIEEATISLQKRYFGTKWSEELQADLYA